MRIGNVVKPLPDFDFILSCLHEIQVILLFICEHDFNFIHISGCMLKFRLISEDTILPVHFFSSKLQ